MRLLLVDDDLVSLESGATLLRRAGYHVDEANTGHEAVRMLLSNRFDLVLIDFRLPDISAFDVIQAVKDRGLDIRWVLFSGFLDFDVAREAGRLGAIHTASLPIDLEALVADALKRTAKAPITGWWKSSLPKGVSPGSAAERWAHLVIRACDAEQDLRTISDWAIAVGASESTVIAACRVVKISPRRARDFMRILRALRRSEGSIAQLEAALSVADPRTYQLLLEHAGLAGSSSSSPISVDEYLALQQFVPSDHYGLVAIKATLRLLF